MVLFLKSGWFKLEAGCLFQPEQQVHILDGLPAGPFQEVVKDRVNNQLLSGLLELDQTFIGAYYLLERDWGPADVCERVIAVELVEEIEDFFRAFFTSQLAADKDAAREIPSPGDEVYIRDTALQLLQGLPDLVEVLEIGR